MFFHVKRHVSSKIKNKHILQCFVCRFRMYLSHDVNRYFLPFELVRIRISLILSNIFDSPCQTTLPKYVTTKISLNFFNTRDFETKQSACSPLAKTRRRSDFQIIVHRVLSINVSIGKGPSGPFPQCLL